VKEGEGPSAQVPQQVQDASSKATIPGAFDFSGVRVEMRPDEAVLPEPIVPVIQETVEAGESQLRQEATTLKRTSQTPEGPLSPGMDLSFAQQVVDPSTPIQERQADPATPIMEMPEDPTTPVLRLSSTPLATPILHLINEEDMQDQDTQGTQDQSQEF